MIDLFGGYTHNRASPEMSANQIVPATDALMVARKYLSYLAAIQSRPISTSANADKRKTEFSRAIDSMRQLGEDWDSEGAHAISEEAISAAEQFATAVAGGIPTPDLGPNTNGTISLYWKWHTGRAEFEFGKTTFSWAIIDCRAKEPQVTHCSGDLRTIPWARTDFVGRLDRLLVGRWDVALHFSGTAMSHSWDETSFVL